jgi:hypothetical protein
MRTPVMTSTIFYCHHGLHRINVAVFPLGFFFLVPQISRRTVSKRYYEGYTYYPKKLIDGYKFIRL